MKTLYVAPAPDMDAFANEVGNVRHRRDPDSHLYIPMNVRTETHMLESGEWGGRKHFFNEELPSVRTAQRSLIFTKDIHFLHYDLGNSMATLYAAYYGSLERREFSLTIHTPLKIGGNHIVGRSLPLLRRKLMMLILVRAHTVFVTSQEMSRTLMELFPRVEREYVGYPLDPENLEGTLLELPFEQV